RLRAQCRPRPTGRWSVRPGYRRPLVGPAALHALVGDQGDGADDGHQRDLTPPPARPALDTTVMGSPEELNRYSGLTLAPEGRVRITAKAPLAASDRSGCSNRARSAGSGCAASALLVVAGRGLGAWPRIQAPAWAPGGTPQAAGGGGVAGG